MSIETRVAVISIIVENEDAAQKINEILHDYRSYVIKEWESHTEAKRGSALSASPWMLPRRRSALFGQDRQRFPGSAQRQHTPT